MFRLFSLSLVFTFSFLLCTAQWYDPIKVSKKATDMYNAAYEDEEDEKFAESIDKINKALTMEPKFVDAYLGRGGVYAELKQYNLSVADFEKAIQLDSVYTKISLLSYSISLAGAGRFTDALTQVNKFLTIDKLNETTIKVANERKSTYEFAIEYDKEHPNKDYVFAPLNLGDSINTVNSEYYPSITIDGSKMIFTRVIKDEDFYESDWVDGKWSLAKPLEGKVNTNFNEGAQNISVDGNWIIFTGCNYPEGKGSCDLYISYKTNNGWTEAENLGNSINTHFWESSPSLSPDKRDLYFSSNRPDGYGGMDIWVSHRHNDGTWSDAENLGPDINTAGDESCPFMYADNQTMFFCTNGRPGYGQNDLFITKKITDTTWSEPKNLGYPINTIDDEGSLIVASDGKTAYYASNRVDTKGGLDLYSFQLRKDIQPPRTLWVKGRVTDAKTKLGLPSSVQLTDLNTRRLISNVQTDEDGNYLTTLPVGNNYDFSVDRKEYLFFSENYDLSDNLQDSVFTVNIPLQPIEAGASIVLRNIFFDTKQTTLKPASIVELNKVIQLMNDNPKLKILISGHTDNVGKPQDNLLLSNGRALAVVRYLLASNQIAKERLLSKGFGATKPIAPNTTDAGRALNRRTELTVISN